MIKSNIPPRFCKKEPEREFRNSGTRGRPLTQRDLPTTLQEADDSSCAAKVRIILFRFAHFFSHRKHGKHRKICLQHTKWGLSDSLLGTWNLELGTNF